ncbi:MAG: hypothetical protein VYB54_02990 [Pseudomonadota bacterium]|nr:hypothetical protein [Pseudomonadota bacterium]
MAFAMLAGTERQQRPADRILEVPIMVTVKDEVAWFTGTGILSQEEILSAIDGLFSESPVKRAILDLRGASLSDISPDRFGAITRAGQAHAAARGPGARTVVCVPNEASQLLVRAFAAYSADSSVIRYDAFLTIEECLDWLGRDD